MPGADLSLLQEVLREAGKLALSFPRPGLKHKQKSDGSVVTEADIAVDDLLRTRIMSARPDDAWLSEETPDVPEARLNKSRLWIVDPIDGTRGFLNSNAPWGIGVALVVDGAPVLGGILLPEDNTLYYASKGGGCWCNGVRIAAPKPNTKVIAPKSFEDSLTYSGLELKSRSSLPLLLRLAAIATGDIGGAISLANKNDWDLAAGHLLVTESGGYITTTDGRPMVYNRRDAWQPGLVAGAVDVHPALLKLVT